MIFAIGNDRRRDWDTLLRAFGNDPRSRVNFVCRWLSEEAVRDYHNVGIIRTSDMATIHALRC